MKKLFLLLAAAFVFVACNDDELDMEYYSQLTPDELITTGEGIEYLVKAHGNVNKATLNDILQTHTLHQSYLYWVDKNEWFPCPVYWDNDDALFVVVDTSKFRACFESSDKKRLHDGTFVKHFYFEFTHNNDPITGILNTFAPNARVVAHYETIVIIQYVEEDYNRVNRVVLQLRKNREEALNKYYNIEDESLYID